MFKMVAAGARLALVSGLLLGWVRAEFQPVWQLGIEDNPQVGPYNPMGEFSAQNNIADPAPGVVTRVAGDPLYNALNNPGADDDFYFTGNYPAGFNGLGALLSVPFPEPSSAWERALTRGDPTNRVHFFLTSAQAAAATPLRLIFELPSGAAVATGVPSSFGDHDIVVRLRNATGATTLLYSNRISAPSRISLDFLASNSVAKAGPNTVEFVRVGPGLAGYSYWIGFNFVRLEADLNGIADKDNDRLPATWEIDNHLSDVNASDAASDRDGDGLTALQEYNLGVNSTDPNRWDTDGDGLSDGRERTLGTDPLSPDTDKDGLTDGEEVDGTPASSPLLADTDGDGAWDIVERRMGTSPTNGTQKPSVFRGAVGIHFVSDTDPEGGLSTNSLAGVIPQIRWNDTRPMRVYNLPSGNTADIAQPVAGQLVRCDGVALPNMKVAWTSLATESSRNKGSADQVLMNGFLRAATTSPVTLTVSNIPFARYDLYVVVGGFVDGYRGRVRLGTDPATDRLFVTQSAPPQNEFIEIPPGNTYRRGNLVRYANLTTPNATLTVSNVSGYALGIHAVQIVDATLDGDGSGIPDWWEVKNGLQPGSTLLAGTDTDGDGLTNLQEFQRGSDPRKVDTDGDGVADGGETTANVLRPDSDGDGLLDGQESGGALPSNVNLVDTDADGVGDFDEVRYRTDPGFKESSSPTFTGWTPKYTATTPKWEWNLENVQLAWNHGVGALSPDELNEDSLVTFGVRNTSGADFRSMTMGLRYYRGVLSHVFSSEAPGAFSAPGRAGAGFRDAPTGSRVQDLTADLGFSGYGPMDLSDRLQFRMIAQRGTGNSWTLTFEIRNQTRNRQVVFRTFSNCTAASAVDLGTATWMNADGVRDRAVLDVHMGVDLYFTPTPLVSFPRFAPFRDTDDDGIPDSWEIANGYNKDSPADALEDRDGDGLDTRGEWVRGTNPSRPDTDGDGISDGVEVSERSNPLDATSRPQFAGATLPGGEDLDGDGFPDSWEVRYSAFNLPPGGDADGDTLTNAQEALWGTDPFDPNSKISLTFTPQAPDVVLSWPNQPGKKQTLFWSSGGNPWVEYTAPPLTMGGVSRVVLSNRIDLVASELYRVDTLDVDSDADGLSDWTERVLGTDPEREDSSRSSMRVLSPKGTVLDKVSGDYLRYVELFRPGATATGQAVSRLQAARFLEQSSFGPTTKELDRVQRMGFAAWIDDQINRQPATYQLPYLRGIVKDYYGPRTDLTYSYNAAGEIVRSSNLATSFARAAIAGPDQLRQRVAFALSQILVISRRHDQFTFRPQAMGSYYDVLVRNAFGNYYDLLREVTFHPAMGVYLSHLGNEKAAPAINQYPDENYAREVQQLFTIGLWELNQDGTRVLNSLGQPIPTYGTREITEFARVFTGMWYAGMYWGRGGVNDEDFNLPMELWPDRHDFGAKTLLKGYVIPARNQTRVNAERDVEDALRSLVDHPNTGPFLGSQLIQFLVTANPSPAYVSRISAVFANDGSGRRGNLGAVIRAILLDPEARDLQRAASVVHYGRLKEPVYRAMALARVEKMDRFDNLLWWDFGQFSDLALQDPLNSPTVFNFFRPNHQPPGLLGDRGLFGPVFQITDSITSIAFPNRLWDMIDGGISYFGTYQFEPDFGDLTAIAGDPGTLLDELNLLFCGGQMSATTRGQIEDALLQVPSYDRMMRVRLAVFLAAACPEGAVQR
ncbi:MAG: DUF1800 family protein [Verrucomicrobiales bacterium]|nr:DUF1800 family protein [Verrucomicrobiales bacterium]